MYCINVARTISFTGRFLDYGSKEYESVCLLELTSIIAVRVKDFENVVA